MNRTLLPAEPQLLLALQSTSADPTQPSAEPAAAAASGTPGGSCPLADIGTPLCLIKGGQTKFTGTLKVDYLRFTIPGESLRSWRQDFINEDPEPVNGRVMGFRRVEKYPSGWWRRFEPVVDMNGFARAYESWEYPGAVPEREVDRARRLLANAEGVRCTKVDLAWDVVGQNYPRAREWYRRLPELGAWSKKWELIDTDESQTLYIGTRRKSAFFIRVYDKGRKYRKEGLIVPEDWVRVEAACSEVVAWTVWNLIVVRRDWRGFAGLLRNFLTGPLVEELIPDGTFILQDSPAKVPDSYRRVVVFLQQNGAMLRELASLGLVDALVGVVPDPCRATQYRCEKLRKDIREIGELPFLDFISSALSVRPLPEVMP